LFRAKKPVFTGFLAFTVSHQCNSPRSIFNSISIDQA
jgi:hypothetical protein